MKSKHFQNQNCPFAQNNFFGITIKLIFMYLLAPFIMQSFKNSLEWIPSYEEASFSSQNCQFAPNENIFRTTINISSMYFLASFIVQNVKKNP